jgi:hypothetical protein
LDEAGISLNAGILLFSDSRETIEAIALSEDKGCSGLRDSNFPADFH